MKALTITLLLVPFLQQSAIGVEICTPGQNFDSGQEELLKTVAQTNEAKTKMLSCAERPAKPLNDPEKRIDYILDTIREIDQMPQNERDNFLNKRTRGVASADFFKQFYHSNNGRDYKSFVAASSTPEHSEPDRAKIEQAVKKKYLEYSKDFGCYPKMSPYFTRVQLGKEDQKQSYERYNDTKKRFDQNLKEGRLVELHNKLTSEPGANLHTAQTNKIYNCRNKYYVDSNYRYYTRSTLPPCSKAFTHHFADNEYELNEKDILASDDFKSLQACVKQRIAFAGDAEVEKIEIVASSSALNNSGKAAAEFGEKDFLSLSKKRAEAAQNTILPKLLPDQDLSKVVDLNYEGSNKDGTSGPCPYFLNEQNDEEYLPGFERGGEKRKGLDQYKKVNITITFKSASKKIDKKVNFVGAYYSCSGVEFKCAN